MRYLICMIFQAPDSEGSTGINVGIHVRRQAVILVHPKKNGVQWPKSKLEDADLQPDDDAR